MNMIADAVLVLQHTGKRALGPAMLDQLLV